MQISKQKEETTLFAAKFLHVLFVKREQMTCDQTLKIAN